MHVGIVACSAEGAALCYRTICAEGRDLFGRTLHPAVSLHAAPFGLYERALERDDWESVAELILDSAAKLQKAGADFLICPDNTIHQALPKIATRLPLPWIHIADVVAEEAKRRGCRRVGLTGTRWLVDSNVYPDRVISRGIALELPSAEERDECSRIIMQELIHGIFKPESTAYFQHVIGNMKRRDCDAVVLGCTEIPLIIDSRNSPLPVLDSTRLLAHAALRYAAAGDKE